MLVGVALVQALLKGAKAMQMSYVAQDLAEALSRKHAHKGQQTQAT